MTISKIMVTPQRIMGKRTSLECEVTLTDNTTRTVMVLVPNDKVEDSVFIKAEVQRIIDAPAVAPVAPVELPKPFEIK